MGEGAESAVRINLPGPRRRRWERKNDADRKQEPEDCRHGSHRPGRIALVEILEQRGHDVVPVARSKGVDVVSGEGLDEALAGAETIIDTATGPSPDQDSDGNQD
jgi:hypothetical protein